MITLKLWYTLSVEIDTSRFDEENLLELEDTVSMYTSLITVDKESDIIYLVHYTI